jgi:integrase
MPTERKRRRRANGEGSIYQRASDAKWVGSAYVYTTKGVRKRRPVYGNSFDEVRGKLDKLKGDSANGVLLPDQNVLVRDYLNYWLQEVVAQKRLTTRRGYESAVRLHPIPVLGTIRLGKLTGADVRRLVAVVRQKCLCCANGYDRSRPSDRQCCSAGRCCGRMPSTRQVQFVHAVLRNALSNAVREELITRYVAKLVQIPTPRYTVGTGLPLDDVKRILNGARCTRLYAVNVPAATLGLRRGELLGLRWSDIDFGRSTVQISQTVQRVDGQLVIDATKPDASDAVVPLPKVTRTVLLRHRDLHADEREKAGDLWQEHGLVFTTEHGRPIEPRYLNTHFDRIRTAVGLPTVRLHDFRHTAVSLLLELGTPPHVVQAVARHADLDVTMRIYAHTNLNSMREAVDKIDWGAA